MELLIDSLKAEVYYDSVVEKVETPFSAQINDYDEVFYEDED